MPDPLHYRENLAIFYVVDAKYTSFVALIQEMLVLHFVVFLPKGSQFLSFYPYSTQVEVVVLSIMQNNNTMHYSLLYCLFEKAKKEIDYFILKSKKMIRPMFYLLMLSLTLLLGGCEGCNGGTKPNPPRENTCNNLKKDTNEEGIDCGGLNGCEPCHDVKTDHELLIRHVKIVDSDEAKRGDLSFGKLIERLVPNDNTKGVLSLINLWSINQESNGISIAARPAVTETIKNLWKERDGIPRNTPDGEWTPNLENAPFRLLAITNRMDLKSLEKNSAGEGRLTFGLTQEGQNNFTLIFEYNLKANDSNDVIKWAKRWHVLSRLEKDSQEYIDTLVNIVNAFTADATHLNQIRTNEVIGGFEDGTFDWELREFNLSNNRFKEVSRKLSPNSDLNNTETLLNYIRENQTDILADEIKETFDGQSFLAGNARYGANFKWRIPEPLFQGQLDTLTGVSCVGCHGGLERNTNFTHIKPRRENQISEISLFLRGDLRQRDSLMHLILEQEQIIEPIVAMMLELESSSNDSLAFIQQQEEIKEIERILNRLKNVPRVH